MGTGLLNKELRTYHCRLANDVQKELGHRCPCCNNVMRRSRKASGENYRDRPTVAHDHPQGFGGNPEVWVWACNACNMEQGRLTFRQWACTLLQRGEIEKGERVGRLADFIDQWRINNAVPAKV